MPGGRTAAPGFACFCLSWAACAAPCQAVPIHTEPCQAEPRGVPWSTAVSPCPLHVWVLAAGAEPWARAARRGGGPFPRRSPSPRPRPRRGTDASTVRWSWERPPELVWPDPRRWLGWAVPRRDDGCAGAALAARLIPAQHGTVHPGTTRRSPARPTSAQPGSARLAGFSPVCPSLAQCSPLTHRLGTTSLPLVMLEHWSASCMGNGGVGDSPLSHMELRSSLQCRIFGLRTAAPAARSPLGVGRSQGCQGGRWSSAESPPQ